MKSRRPDFSWERQKRLLSLFLGNRVGKARQTWEMCDSARCFNIAHDVPVDDLRDRLAELPELNFVHVDHAALTGGTERNIIQLARRDAAIRAKPVMLANAGFHLYALRKGHSSLVHHRRIPTLWNRVISGEVVTRLVGNVDESARLTAVCSTRSPRFRYKERSFLDRFRDRFLFKNQKSSNTKDYPHFGHTTLRLNLSLLNMALAGPESPIGVHTVYQDP